MTAGRVQFGSVRKTSPVLHRNSNWRQTFTKTESVMFSYWIYAVIWITWLPATDSEYDECSWVQFCSSKSLNLESKIPNLCSSTVDKKGNWGLQYCKSGVTVLNRLKNVKCKSNPVDKVAIVIVRHNKNITKVFFVSKYVFWKTMIHRHTVPVC